MRVMHTLRNVAGICPVNGEKDSYMVLVVIVQPGGMEPVAVESILDVVSVLTQAPIFQESLTARLAEAVQGGVQGRKVTVRTLGEHGPADSRVATDCTAEV